MTDLEQADQLATHEYLKNGYFGGRKPSGSKTIQYFDFEGRKKFYLEQLENKQIWGK